MITPSVRLVRELGAGGMGKVWIADHLALRTRIVVKFLAAELQDDVRTRARFSREAAAASQVKSPHVVQMLDHGVAPDGTPFIAMELLEGRDLRAHLQTRGRLPVSEVVAIVRQVAKALSKAHERGIVHRDIKPENIFLCDTIDPRDPFVKILDFGIAKGGEHCVVADFEATQAGMLIGTPDYMSPEQLLGGEVDARSDLWALGVVAFQALTGHLPFIGRNLGELALALHGGVTSRPSELVPSIPQAIDGWFCRVCAGEKSDRFQSARELADALAEAAGETGDASGARPWPTMTEVPLASSLTPCPMSVPVPANAANTGNMVARRSSGARWAFAATVLLVLAGTGVFFARQGDQRVTLAAQWSEVVPTATSPSPSVSTKPSVSVSSIASVASGSAKKIVKPLPSFPKRKPKRAPNAW
jgi:serine/threonine protein kinase